MKVTVFPHTLSGTIAAIPAKSYAHRILILAALCGSETKIYGLYTSEDVIATMKCLEALGVEFIKENSIVTVRPPENFAKKATLDCAESGSTLRFLLPVAAALDVEAEFIGRGNLPTRPMNEPIAVLKKHGVCADNNRLPLKITGSLVGSEFTIDGSLSSQYVTGMLLAMSALGKKCRLNVIGKKVSGSYIDITIEILRAFGMTVTNDDTGITVEGKLTSPREITVEGDWSNAAFWLVAGVIGEKSVAVSGLNVNSRQGDSAIIEKLKLSGAKIECLCDTVTAYPSKLHGAEYDCSDCPDIIPILSVAAAFADGETVIHGVNRLKIKECDRLLAIERLLRGAHIATKYEDDTLTIVGGCPRSTSAEGFGDHRIIMSSAILGVMSGVEIDDACGVKKSYPDFFADLEKLGGKYDAL